VFVIVSMPASDSIRTIPATSFASHARQWAVELGGAQQLLQCCSKVLVSRLTTAISPQVKSLHCCPVSFELLHYCRPLRLKSLTSQALCTKASTAELITPSSSKKQHNAAACSSSSSRGS
jgi:hypothetical protein